MQYLRQIFRCRHQESIRFYYQLHLLGRLGSFHLKLQPHLRHLESFILNISNQQDFSERFQFAKIQYFHHHTETCQTQRNSFIIRCSLCTKHSVQPNFTQKLLGSIFSYSHRCPHQKQIIQKLVQSYDREHLAFHCNLFEFGFLCLKILPCCMPDRRSSVKMNTESHFRVI